MILVQEKKIKGLLQLLKDLVQITVLAQKEDHGAGGEQSLPTGQTKAGSPDTSATAVADRVLCRS